MTADGAPLGYFNVKCTTFYYTSRKSWYLPASEPLTKYQNIDTDFSVILTEELANVRGSTRVNFGFSQIPQEPDFFCLC